MDGVFYLVGEIFIFMEKCCFVFIQINDFFYIGIFVGVNNLCWQLFIDNYNFEIVIILFEVVLYIYYLFKVLKKRIFFKIYFFLMIIKIKRVILFYLNVNVIGFYCF